MYSTLFKTVGNEVHYCQIRLEGRRLLVHKDRVGQEARMKLRAIPRWQKPEQAFQKALEECFKEGFEEASEKNLSSYLVEIAFCGAWPSPEESQDFKRFETALAVQLRKKGLGIVAQSEAQGSKGMIRCLVCSQKLADELVNSLMADHQISVAA